MNIFFIVIGLIFVKVLNLTKVFKHESLLYFPFWMISKKQNVSL